jgi:hypothetical protein
LGAIESGIEPSRRTRTGRDNTTPEFVTTAAPRPADAIDVCRTFTGCGRGAHLLASAQTFYERDFDRHASRERCAAGDQTCVDSADCRVVMGHRADGRGLVDRSVAVEVEPERRGLARVS